MCQRADQKRRKITALASERNNNYLHRQLSTKFTPGVVFRRKKYNLTHLSGMCRTRLIYNCSRHVCSASKGDFIRQTDASINWPVVYVWDTRCAEMEELFNKNLRTSHFTSVFVTHTICSANWALSCVTNTRSSTATFMSQCNPSNKEENVFEKNKAYITIIS